MRGLFALLFLLHFTVSGGLCILALLIEAKRFIRSWAFRFQSDNGGQRWQGLERLFRVSPEAAFHPPSSPIPSSSSSNFDRWGSFGISGQQEVFFFFLSLFPHLVFSLCHTHMTRQPTQRNRGLSPRCQANFTLTNRPPGGHWQRAGLMQEWYFQQPCQNIR